MYSRNSVEHAMGRLPANIAEGLDALPQDFLDDIRAQIQLNTSSQRTMDAQVASEIIFNAALKHDIGPISIAYLFMKSNKIHELFDHVSVYLPDYHNGYTNGQKQPEEKISTAEILGPKDFFELSQCRVAECEMIGDIVKKAFTIIKKIDSAINNGGDELASDREISMLGHYVLILPEYIQKMGDNTALYELSLDVDTASWLSDMCSILARFTHALMNCATMIEGCGGQRAYLDQSYREIAESILKIEEDLNAKIQQEKDSAADGLESAKMLLQAEEIIKQYNQSKKVPSKKQQAAEPNELENLGTNLKRAGKVELATKYLMQRGGVGHLTSGEKDAMSHIDERERSKLDAIPPQFIKQLFSQCSESDDQDSEIIIQIILNCAREYSVPTDSLVWTMVNTNIIAKIAPNHNAKQNTDRLIHIANVKEFIINDVYELYWCYLAENEQQRVEYFERRVRNTMMQHGDMFEVRADGLCHLIEEAIFIGIELRDFLTVVLGSIEHVREEYISNEMKAYRKKIAQATSLEEAINIHPVTEIKSEEVEVHGLMNFHKLIGLIQLLWFELYTSYMSSGDTHPEMQYMSKKWITEYTECNLNMPSPEDIIVSMDPQEYSAYIDSQGKILPDKESKFMERLTQQNDRYIEYSFAQYPIGELCELRRLITFINFAYTIAERDRNMNQMYGEPTNNQCIEAFIKSPSRITQLFKEHTKLSPELYFMWVEYLGEVIQGLIDDPEYKEALRKSKVRKKINGNGENTVEVHYRAIKPKVEKRYAKRGRKLTPSKSTPSKKVKKKKQVGRTGSGKNGK